MSPGRCVRWTKASLGEQLLAQAGPRTCAPVRAGPAPPAARAAADPLGRDLRILPEPGLDLRSHRIQPRGRRPPGRPPRGGSLALQGPAHGLDVQPEAPGQLLLRNLLHEMLLTNLGPLRHSDHLRGPPRGGLETVLRTASIPRRGGPDPPPAQRARGSLFSAPRGPFSVCRWPYPLRSIRPTRSTEVHTRHARCHGNTDQRYPNNKRQHPQALPLGVEHHDLPCGALSTSMIAARAPWGVDDSAA